MKHLLPPQLFVLFAVLMGLVCWGLGVEHSIPYPYNLTGMFALAGGLFIAQSSKNQFRKAGTTVMTFDRPDVLVTGGWFRFSRNPMYLGFVVALTGVAVLYQGSVPSFLLAASFAVIVDRWYVRFEERLMSERFGEAYERYRSETRRWI